MADVESLFDFVHMEIVAYFTNRPGKNVDVSIAMFKKRSPLKRVYKIITFFIFLVTKMNTL